ncbi:hypothetical protein HZS_7588 [Henneguya salminicola]|nr:hypothetical protein HZS_7588 [Henneguya salminicola]
MFAASAFIHEDNHYEDTFIGKHNRTGRSQPLFPIRLWSPCKKRKMELVMLIIKVEGWHNAFARLIGRNHSNLFKFLVSLQDKLSLVGIKIDTIHMRTTQQKASPVYNQIHRQLI